MWDEAVDDRLVAFNFIPDWFVTSETLEKFHDAKVSDFSELTFFTYEMGILGVDLNKINLDDDNNFHEDDPKTIMAQ